MDIDEIQETSSICFGFETACTLATEEYGILVGKVVIGSSSTTTLGTTYLILT